MAPLRELANPNLTPNPSKAPWYFLGLQELLRYFHPMIAGITIPTFILVGLAAVPYVDRNPSVKPGDRKIAISMFTVLFASARRSHHRVLLPRTRLQLGLALGARGVLRPMTLAISNGVIAAIIVFLVLDIFAVIFGLSFARAAKDRRPRPTARPPHPAGSGHVAS